MKNKNNNTKFIVKALMAMLFVAAVGSVNASTLKLDATGFDVKSAAGVSVSTNLGAKFGYFASGFTATSANLAQWDENFISMNGQWTASTKRFQISLVAGDNNVGGGTATGTTAYGVTIPVNTPLYLLVSNSAYNSAASTNASTNADYLLPQAGITAATTQYALLTDSSWKMLTASALDVTTTVLGFTVNTGISGGFGSYNSATSTITLNAIPEPSSASLLALGVAGLVALRVRRKS
ncbi:MAG: PEP-CTERM sorting domain-containing protein [Proteobacteria bacterium]|nr:PEP-CTERM sorting domain-containing protein [Pseudomonadota bacterium]NBS07289.1 PEP-CTERM sorting domain-containing protein [Verrucomicrobiota bacterium]NBS79886.1 PEP-CTERM sorting domain-containing protein [bacterium]NBT49147.1 PEP-CTERM sorting domain-containing protein [Actinomycetota bacterium]